MSGKKKRGWTTDNEVGWGKRERCWVSRYGTEHIRADRGRSKRGGVNIYDVRLLETEWGTSERDRAIRKWVWAFEKHF